MRSPNPPERAEGEIVGAVVRPVVHVMHFRDVENLRIFGRAIWAALAEAAAFYTRGRLVSSYQRFFFDPNRQDAPLRTELPSSLEAVRADVNANVVSSSKSLPYRLTDQRQMDDEVRRALGTIDRSVRLLICTDQQIVPPENWRYILWDGVEEDVVLSMAAMDPRFWGLTIPEHERAAIVKHRVRTAALNGSGVQLGLKNCDNPGCFLNGGIISVQSLDAMEILGAEHGQSLLTDTGFAWPSADLGLEQPIVHEPEVLQRASRYAQ